MDVSKAFDDEMLHIVSVKKCLASNVKHQAGPTCIPHSSRHQIVADQLRSFHYPGVFLHTKRTILASPSGPRGRRLAHSTYNCPELNQRTDE